MKRLLLGLNRKVKLLILISSDFLTGLVVWFVFGTPLPSFLSNPAANSLFEITVSNLNLFLIPISSTLLFFLISGFYKPLVRFKSSGEDFWKASLGASFFGLFYIFIFISGNKVIEANYFFIFLINALLLSSMFLSGITLTREIAKYILLDAGKDEDATPVVIYGAGAIGLELAQTIRFDQSRKIIAFFDDESDLHGSSKQGIPILSKLKNLRHLKEKHKNLEIFLAIPKLSSFKRRSIIEKLESLEVSVKSVPAYHELISDNESLTKLQRLSLEDVLPSGRIDNLDFNYLKDSIILVTGAGGSIGSELVRQVLSNKPKEIILFDNSEFNLYKIYHELDSLINSSIHKTILTTIVGDVKSIVHLTKVFRNNKINFVFHAAAYKHVPILESELNISIAADNNILGTHNVCKLSLENNVKKFVLISTDKAVRPTNVMGASKRMAELVCQAFSMIDSETIFSMVRFGNVIDSSGSVIPLFRDQISRGGPVTITHKDITRYFMTIPEAASLVINAAKISKGGEVFLLDMGEQLQVIKLAERMIRLSGRNVSKHPGDGGIEIIEIGLRAGEKLYEELLISGLEEKTDHPKIFKSNEQFIPMEELTMILDKLRRAIESDNVSEIREILINYVDGYNV